MTSSDRVLARRYARALYQISAEGKREEKTLTELMDARKALLDQGGTLNHPMVTSSKKKAALQKALPAKTFAGTTKFLELLIDKKRFPLLSMIVLEYDRILDEEKGRVKAQVKSAGALTSAQQEALRKKLKNFSGKDVELDIKVDPELLGGVIVRMEDWVIDGSLRGKLKRLGAELAAGHS